jgi:predicted nuclease with TOPRIM domain
MQRRSVPPTDPRYNQLRSRNNDSVKKSREKARRERDDTSEAINQLEEENEELTECIRKLKQEYEQLQDLFKQHTGISIDQLPSQETNSNSKPSVQPKPIEQPKEIPSQPVLTINTNEETTATTSSDIQLDPSTLDGAIVLINGVQYKIVSMNKT